jgi:hypothetical protein
MRLASRESQNMKWHPATIEEVKVIVHGDLAECHAEQAAVFERYRVEPYLASLVRYGKLDNVVVVARRGAEVIYWEDVEIGFNLSSVANDGTILEHWCNQDDLGLALNCWIKGRTRPPNVGPARPVE